LPKVKKDIMPKASIIISYYNNISNLHLILKALNKAEKSEDIEVIISEDNNAAETIRFIEEIRKIVCFPIIHEYQEDQGFRKCLSLNNAIKISNSDSMIFIDGDCIPHKKFISSYLKAKKKNTVLFGRRVVLSEKISQKIINQKKIDKITIFKLIISHSKRIEDSLYFPLLNKLAREKLTGILLGCNMGINKEELIAINGFDEDYNFPGGGEDSDIEWRLKYLPNIKFVSMRFQAIVYHLYHPQFFDDEKKMKSTLFMKNKIKNGNYFCKNGIKKIA